MKRRKPRSTEILRDDLGFPYPEEDTRPVSAVVMGKYLNCGRSKVWRMKRAKKFPRSGLIRSGRITQYIPAVIYRIKGWGRCVQAHARVS